MTLQDGGPVVDASEADQLVGMYPSIVDPISKIMSVCNLKCLEAWTEHCLDMTSTAEVALGSELLQHICPATLTADAGER